MKFLITGVAGFLGSSCAEKFLELGHEIIGIDSLVHGGTKENLLSHKDYRFFYIDIAKEWYKLLELNLKDVDVCFHFAAKARIQPSIIDPRSTIENNIMCDFNTLELCRRNNINKIIYACSSTSYGLNPIPCVEDSKPDLLAPYSVSKHVGEMFCKTWGKIYGIKNVCLKYFNAYGPKSALTQGAYSPVIGLWFKNILEEKKPISIVEDGHLKRRDYTYVDDIIDANLKAFSNIDNINGETINIGKGQNYSVYEVAGLIKKELLKYNIKTETRTIPKRPGEALETLADISKAKRLLNWEPKISLEEGIQKLTPFYIKKFS